MKNPLIFLALVTLIWGCNSENTREKVALADLNLYLETDREIDSVLVANYTQDTEYQLFAYSDTIKVTFNNRLNDYYILKFFTGEGEVVSTLWLDGEKVTVKGKINGSLTIDTVIGSDLYYQSIDFRNKYSELDDTRNGGDTLNNFLLEMLDRYIHSPFSLEIANDLFQRNMNDRDQLEKIYQLLDSQDDTLRNDPLNPYKDVEKLLNTTKIDFTRFKFYNTDEQLTSVKLEAGKKYLLDFWFVACPPCLEQHRSMTEKIRLLRSRNVEVIGISIDENHRKWKDFLAKKNYPWLHLREVEDRDEMLSIKMLVYDFPTYLFIDHRGNILFRANSFKEAEANIFE